MKTEKWIFMIIQVLFFSTSTLFTAYAAQQKPSELIYTTFFSASHKHAQLGDAWAKEIEKRTHGKLKIRYLP